MLGTTLRSLTPETYRYLRELVAELREEQPELYNEIEKNLIHVAEQCNNVSSVIEKLKAIRIKQRFSMEEFAERTGIARQSLLRLENSPLANPQVHTLQRYALALGHELKIKVIQKKKRRVGDARKNEVRREENLS